jgi:two-component system sensor histidine kinase/response regulator
LSVESTEFQLDTVLENVASLIADKASSKGLELVLDVDPECPTTCAAILVASGRCSSTTRTTPSSSPRRARSTSCVRKREETEGDVVLTSP